MAAFRRHEGLAFGRTDSRATEEANLDRPDLVAEIEYWAWTGDGKLRHASFKGFRWKADSDARYELEG